MIRTILIVLASLASGLFLYAYYTQYFRWRECFNELGRCLDSESGAVYTEQSGPVWLGLALLVIVLTLWLVLSRNR